MGVTMMALRRHREQVEALHGRTVEHVYCTTYDYGREMRRFSTGYLWFLAPTQAMVYGYKGYAGYEPLTWAQFAARYWSLLSSRRTEVETWLRELDPAQEIVLLCFCGSTQRHAGRCHTALIARLIRKYRPDVPVTLA